MVLNNPFRQRETKAVTGLFFCREERLEYLLHVLEGYSLSVVGNQEFDPIGTLADAQRQVPPSGSASSALRRRFEMT